MIVVPAETPVIIPVIEPAVATATLLLVHTPLWMASDSTEIAPAHIVPAPIIAVGCVVTETIVVATHPDGSAYVIMVVPADNAETIPEEEPTVPTAILLLLHMPPVLVSLKAEVDPEQILVVPVIAPGNGFTVSEYIEKQPPAISWKVIAVVPADTPVIMPVMEPMEATPVLLLLHMPLGVGSDNTEELAGQVTTGPEIGAG